MLSVAAQISRAWLFKTVTSNGRGLQPERSVSAFGVEPQQFSGMFLPICIAGSSSVMASVTIL